MGDIRIIQFDKDTKLIDLDDFSRIFKLINKQIIKMPLVQQLV